MGSAEAHRNTDGKTYTSVTAVSRSAIGAAAAMVARIAKAAANFILGDVFGCGKGSGGSGGGEGDCLGCFVAV